jgi:hypothetical protein
LPAGGWAIVALVMDMKDRKKIYAVAWLLDAGGLTLADIRGAPVAQLINLRDLEATKP